MPQKRGPAELGGMILVGIALVAACLAGLGWYLGTH